MIERARASRAARGRRRCRRTRRRSHEHRDGGQREQRERRVQRHHAVAPLVAARAATRTALKIRRDDPEDDDGEHARRCRAAPRTCGPRRRARSGSRRRRRRSARRCTTTSTSATRRRPVGRRRRAWSRRGGASRRRAASWPRATACVGHALGFDVQRVGELRAQPLERELAVLVLRAALRRDRTRDGARAARAAAPVGGARATASPRCRSAPRPSCSTCSRAGRPGPPDAGEPPLELVERDHARPRDPQQRRPRPRLGGRARSA